MRIQYIIKDIVSSTYFLGASPYPVFGALSDGVVYFDSYEEAESRLNEEVELFGTGRFESMTITIVMVYIV